MTYLPEESKVIYESKDHKKEEVFDGLESLVAMTSHVPNKGEQMVRIMALWQRLPWPSAKGKPQ